MIFGYSRVSRAEQNLDSQRDALKRAGCERIIEDAVSGGKLRRPGLERVHDALRSGDVLAVFFARSPFRSGRTRARVVEIVSIVDIRTKGTQF